VQNRTYKPGIENVVHRALTKTTLSSGQFRLVEAPTRADAVLRVTVQQASYGVAGKTKIEETDSFVADIYHATLSIQADLLEKEAGEQANGTPDAAQVLWSSSFSRGKTFQATPQLGAAGTTTGLIIDSAFERALGDLADQLATD